MTLTPRDLRGHRNFLETRWPQGSSARQCIRTAWWLREVLGGTLQGGWPTPHRTHPGGYHDGEAWHFHYWLLRAGQIIDLTADQFGAAPIIVTSAADPRYRAVASAHDIKQDTAHTPLTTRAWLAAWQTRRTGDAHP